MGEMCRHMQQYTLHKANLVREVRAQKIVVDKEEVTECFNGGSRSNSSE